MSSERVFELVTEPSNLSDETDEDEFGPISVFDKVDIVEQITSLYHNLCNELQEQVVSVSKDITPQNVEEIAKYGHMHYGDKISKLARATVIAGDLLKAICNYDAAKAKAD